MIAKVPKRRADGRSSFAALTAYIAKSASALLCSDALWSVETAAREMNHVARANKRCADPVYHYVLSWPHPERPSDDQAFDVAQATLLDLGLLDHQWIGAIHRHTGHFHIHVAVNRIHPTTLRAVSPRRDWLTLDRACRSAELKYGWSHDRGPHFVVSRDGEPEILRKENERSNVPIPQSGSARDFTAWTGLVSFQTWVAGEPARDLSIALQNASRSWQTVHDVLRAYGLAYQLKGGGAVVVDRGSPDRYCAKASHLGRWASLARLQSLLGPFEPNRDFALAADPHPSSKKARTSYRDLIGGPRIEPIVSRHQRDALWERYDRERTEWQSTGLSKYRATCLIQRGSEVERLHHLQESVRLERDRIRNGASRPRRLLYSLAARRGVIARQALRLDIQQERSALRAARERAAPGGWIKWLQAQASVGDERATQRLRRLSMQERRRVDFSSRTVVGTLHSTKSPRRVILDQCRVIVRPTCLDYCIDGKLAFRDENRRLVLFTYSRDAVSASLLLAREKWGARLSTTGAPNFNQLVASIAPDLGISVLDSERLRHEHVFKSPIDLGDLTATRPTDNWVDELRRLSREVGKPHCIPSPRSGDRFTGKVVTALSTSDDKSVIILDVGRSIAAIPWNHVVERQKLPRRGAVMSARVVCRDGRPAIWQFISREPPGVEPTIS